MNRRRPTLPAGVTDGLITAGVAVMLLVVGLSGERPGGGRDLLGYALLAVSGLALAGRRRAPLLTLALTGLCAVGYQAVGFDVPAVAFLFAVYAAVRAGHRLVTVVAMVAMLLMM